MMTSYGFAYRGDKATQIFLPRDGPLTELRADFLDNKKPAEGVLREYLASLLHGWMRYLAPDEAIVIERRPNVDSPYRSEPSGGSVDIASIYYHIQRNHKYDSDPEARRILVKDFRNMPLTEQSRFIRENREVLLLGGVKFRSLILADGVVSPYALFFGSYFGYFELYLKDPDKDFISPEEYVGRLNFLDILRISLELSRDTHIYTRDEARKYHNFYRLGEVCLECKEVLD